MRWKLSTMLAVMVIAGCVAAVMAWRVRRLNLQARCVSNLALLYKAQHDYLRDFGGVREDFPPETGGEFWMALTRTRPPLVDDTRRGLLKCPMLGGSLESTDYRGPRNSGLKGVGDGAPVGADRVGNHGSARGGNVICRSGDVFSVADDDVLWRQAAVTTRP